MVVPSGTKLLLSNAASLWQRQMKAGVQYIHITPLAGAALIREDFHTLQYSKG